MLQNGQPFYAIAPDKPSCSRVTEHLQTVLKEYLSQHPQLSVNAMSKRCNVSEPTLRRIVSGKVKTEPHITTLLDILSHISGTSSVIEITQRFAGPISEYILESMPYVTETKPDYSSDVNNELKHPTKYLIYKLAVNQAGLTKEKLVELFGNHSVLLVDEMVSSGLLQRDEYGTIKTVSKTLTSSNDDFVRNFKLVADFIKPEKAFGGRELGPLFVNCSDSINAEAYNKIIEIQRASQAQIREILVDSDSRGRLPFFMLVGIDILDSKSAYEFQNQES